MYLILTDKVGSDQSCLGHLALHCHPLSGIISDIERFAHLSAKYLIQNGLMGEKNLVEIHFAKDLANINISS